ncbi:Hypothetical protein A7982_04370 [Minicystis rosea]|nr:Hypothetical protein A7982_04370 [Minicystis rosea]
MVELVPAALPRADARYVVRVEEARRRIEALEAELVARPELEALIQKAMGKSSRSAPSARGSLNFRGAAGGVHVS